MSVAISLLHFKTDARAEAGKLVIASSSVISVPAPSCIVLWPLIPTMMLSVWTPTSTVTVFLLGKFSSCTFESENSEALYTFHDKEPDAAEKTD